MTILKKDAQFTLVHRNKKREYKLFCKESCCKHKHFQSFMFTSSTEAYIPAR